MILSQDSILQILSYLSPKDKYLLTKEYYSTYHKEVFEYIYKKQFIKFIDDIIKRDNAFVLSQIINDVPRFFNKRIPIIDANATTNHPKTTNILNFCRKLAFDTEAVKCYYALARIPSRCHDKG